MDCVFLVRYASFNPIDEKTLEEVANPKLTELVKMMYEWKLAFEIDCDEDPRQKGTLYLFGMNAERRYSLFGVYLPKNPQPQPQQAKLHPQEATITTGRREQS